MTATKASWRAEGRCCRVSEPSQERPLSGDVAENADPSDDEMREAFFRLSFHLPQFKTEFVLQRYDGHVWNDMYRCDTALSAVNDVEWYKANRAERGPYRAVRRDIKEDPL